MTTSPFKARVSAVGVAAALALTISCGGRSASPTEPPVAASSSPLGPIAVLAVRSDAKPALAVLGGALVFDASESVGAGLSYSISFGDGEQTTKASESHVPRSAGAKTARLTVTDSAGRTSSIEVPYFVSDIQTAAASVWRYVVNPATQIGLQLTQAEGRVSGRYYETGATAVSRALTGDIIDGRRLRLATDDGDVSIDAVLDWASDAPASCLQVSCVRFRGTFRGGVADGRTAEFSTINADPPVARLEIEGELQPVIGWVNVTPFAFDASNSTGFGLTYRIDFGDGQSSTRPTVSHATHEYGRRFARLTVTDFLGRTSTNEQIYVAADLSHWWYGGEPGVGGVRFFLHPTFDGRLDGTFDFQSLSGQIGGQRDIRVVRGDGVIEVEGRLEWAPDYQSPMWGCLTGPANPSLPPSTISPDACFRLRVVVRGGPLNGRTILLQPFDY